MYFTLLPAEEIYILVSVAKQCNSCFKEMIILKTLLSETHCCALDIHIT